MFHKVGRKSSQPGAKKPYTMTLEIGGHSAAVVVKGFPKPVCEDPGQGSYRF
jgi:hypothetical protein